LKNESVEPRNVTPITEFVLGLRQNGIVLARRSLGVVLIVALVGWTVNWLRGVQANTLGQQFWCWQELHLPTNLNLPLRATTAAHARAFDP
jgi:hypothetical protein